MYNKNFYLVLVAFFALSAAFGQEITLTGTVKDSIGVGIDMANVIAINTETKALESYGITNHSGLYKLNLKSGAKFDVRVSYLGFKTEEFSFTAPTNNVNKDIVLREQTNQLDEVEVTYEMPISVKGDTIVYDTDSFVTGTEKKLKDVLANLPGVEINDDGQIEVEGKRVTKVMVEGKDFFDGDSKLAAENIPANALDKIEVLRNFNEVTQMKGLTNDTDNVALNIKLKEGKKRFWFGEITAGYGTNDSYLAHPKLFYYSPDYSINIITDLNNIGEAPFNRRDYQSFTGGFRNLGSTSGSSIDIGGDGLGLSSLQNNRAKNINTKFAAVNFSYSPKENWDLSGFGIYSYTGTLMENQTRRVYISSNETEDATTATDQTAHLGLAKFSSMYKPNDRFQFDYDVLLKKSDDYEVENVLSISNITDEITETKKQKPISVSQNANIYYTSLNAKNIIAFEAQHIYQDEDPFYNAIRDNFAFTDLFPVDEGQNIYNLNQGKNTITNKVDAKVDYYLVTGMKSNLNFTLGTTQSRQNFDSDIFQILDGGESLNFTDDEFNNDVTYNVSDLYLGFHYKVIAGIFTFNPGATLHQYGTKNTQLGTTVEDNLTALLPDLYINAQLKKSENIRFNYRVSRSFTDVNNFAEAYVLNNYNSVYSGNRDLESALNHNLSLNFFSFNMFNFTNIFGNVTYTKRIDALKSSSEIIGINRIGTTINSNLEDESLSANGRYQRTFGKIKASVGANISWSTTNNIVDLEPRKSESFTQNYTSSLATNFRNAPNLELGYRYSVNNYDNGGRATTYYTSRPFAKFDASFLKSFIFTLDYDYYKYSDKENTIDNTYSFLEGNLSYQKKDSPWEFGIKGTNLLDTSTLNRDSTNELYFTTSSYFIQPRYVLFTVKYDL
ncbi:carboxypeptidase-like regulatory domain-containing protein [Arenibacter sp. F26102]|uniref:carboxypeptidase-like regulatory domain-containing protein n=1 Tax=Arenibacter sp. F26102 TaxID=2926416 RepID=UPI001FF32F63|nr:carboxypeptidase-like regulatory domain-containing protein [Arenibacter sp. F26102]MCK0144620.1 carboxypeptidase-like regulatory domain-containing protein [Arenibacter sp. F26102]